MNKKISKFRCIVGRMLAVAGILIIVVSSFIVPASADMLTDQMESSIEYDPWFRGAIVNGRSSTAGFHYTFDFDSTFRTYDTYGSYTWNDYFRTSGPGVSNISTVGFTHRVTPANHLMSFTNDVANSVFSMYFTVTFSNLVLDYDNVDEFVPTFDFSGSSGAFNWGYNVKYHCPVYDASLGSYVSFVSSDYITDSSGVFHSNRINLLPTVDNVIKRYPSYVDSNGVEVFDRYVFIEELIFHIQLDYVEDLSAVQFRSWRRDLCPWTYDPAPYFSQIPSHTEFVPITVDADFTEWLVTAIGGFLDFEIFPGLSFAALLGVVGGIGVVLAFLRIFAGG